MRRDGLWHPGLLAHITALGHGQMIVIADPGLPVPRGVPTVDLVWTADQPRFLPVLHVLMRELVVERAVTAEELSDHSILGGLVEALDGVPVTRIPHEDLKRRLAEATVVVRTGETTPYANIILDRGGALLMPTHSLRHDYEERVYAGVLGKIIAVYLGRPFEGWRYDRIMRDLGEITGYVNDRVDLPLKNHLLVVTDDDISGTILFPRALEDVPVDQPLDPQAVARTWLNEIVPGRTVLWWGGLGNSTEHTAYLRLSAGVPAPYSGSEALNGTVVAEQVGAQIFCEGFAMTCPGDPEGAADLVERAASVSHDGEALQAARMVGGMVAAAFDAIDVDEILDAGLAQTNPNCLIAQVVRDVRAWSAEGDWHATRARIEEAYGYDRYGGNCHVVPNHAVVVAAVAHSGGDFARAMTVVTTSGWDTDSNAGDVGSIMGVFCGLAALSSGPDYRSPIGDRLYLPTADAGAAITDAAREALRLAAHGRRRHGQRRSSPRTVPASTSRSPGQSKASRPGPTPTQARGGRTSARSPDPMAPVGCESAPPPARAPSP